MTLLRCKILNAGAALVAGGFVSAMLLAQPAQATKIERVISPGGIEAWLVHEPAVPLIAVQFALHGGANQDPADKPGVSYMVSAMLDEGAGELDAKAFQQRLDRSAVEMSFRARRDDFYGSLRILREHKDEGIELLRLALTAPRFDNDAIERVRAQMLSGLRRETTNPSDIASRLWWKTAFPRHPYGQPLNGTLESVPTIEAADLRDYTRRVFTREHLKVAVVGDIDAETLKPLLDKVFGALPAKGALAPVPPVQIEGVGQKAFVDLNVPQAVLSFGGAGIARKDKDFIPAYIVNHILGGGSFSSRLYREVREKRGLAYSVYSFLLPLERTALFMGGTATRADRAKETLGLIEAEIRRLAAEGPTQKELDECKSYLKGSYALNFDTSTKIASQLLQIQMDDLGIDYINRRNGLIDAVTLDDVKRVAKRLLDGGIFTTMVGPTGEMPKRQGG